jgi:signal transduction histidine kinase
MRFVPKLGVGQRLTATMILVVVVSWLLGGILGYQAMRLNLFRPPARRPPPGGFPADRRGPPPARPGMMPGGLEQARPGPPPEFGPGRGPGGPGRRPPPPFWRSPNLYINLGAGVVVALVAGLWLSRRFTRPLATLAEGAGALRAGELSHRIPVKGDDEFGRVAVSMNQMAERIAEQIRELEADARRRQHLLADVAHELRSPVARLRAMAEALSDGVAHGPERTERAARTIAASSARMERLVNDLLDLARLDLNELPLYPQPVDLRAAAADAVRGHGEAAARAQIQLHSVAGGEPALVLADPHRLAQILDNLLDNAISHAGAGAEVSVTVETGEPAVVTITDTGRGIASEHLQYIFDAFYRGDAARTPGSHHSGLGLRIARSLARAHGGDLRVESAEGRGTQAMVTFPMLGPSAVER